MENIKTVFSVVMGTMLLMCAVVFLCPGKFEKKLILMLATGFVFLKIMSFDYDFSFNLRKFTNEYNSVIEDAENFSNSIRLSNDNADYGDKQNE